MTVISTNNCYRLLNYAILVKLEKKLKLSELRLNIYSVLKCNNISHSAQDGFISSAMWKTLIHGGNLYFAVCLPWWMFTLTACSKLLSLLSSHRQNVRLAVKESATFGFNRCQDVHTARQEQCVQKGFLWISHYDMPAWCGSRQREQILVIHNALIHLLNSLKGFTH